MKVTSGPYATSCLCKRTSLSLLIPLVPTVEHKASFGGLLIIFRHAEGILGPSQSPLLTQDNTTHKRKEKHPCLERDSNPRSQ
jgi:hypothetical protein